MSPNNAEAFRSDEAGKQQDYEAEEDEQHSWAEMRKYEGRRFELWPQPGINNTANE